MKVIFLDVDGVLNDGYSTYFDKWREYGVTDEYSLTCQRRDIDPQAFFLLIDFINKYKLKVVLSSGRRLDRLHYSTIKQMITDNTGYDTFIGCTEVLFCGGRQCRCVEITDFMDKKGLDYNDIVVLDDCDLDIPFATEIYNMSGNIDELNKIKNLQDRFIQMKFGTYLNQTYIDKMKTLFGFSD